MPLQIPTLADVRALSRDNMLANIAGSETWPPNARGFVVSDSNAALAFGAYQYLVQLAIQFLPDTATAEWLDRWANIFGVPREAATYAAGQVAVTGTSGTPLPSGSQFAANGIAYESTAAATVGVGPTNVPVQALTAGVTGNMAAGQSVSLSNAISGVDAAAAVVLISGGVDTEDDDSLRDRVLARIQKPPMGGDADDYVAWAREIPGVTRAWSSPNEQGPGTVTLRFMMDSLRATTNVMTSGFPTPDDVAIVQAHIDSVRPVTADVFVRAPVPEPVGFSVSGLSVDSASTRAAVANSVSAMLVDRAAPARAVNGYAVPAQTIYRAWISDAVLNTAGVDHFDLSMADHVMPTKGSMAVLGTITYA